MFMCGVDQINWSEFQELINMHVMYVHIMCKTYLKPLRDGPRHRYHTGYMHIYRTHRMYIRESNLV